HRRSPHRRPILPPREYVRRVSAIEVFHAAIRMLVALWDAAATASMTGSISGAAHSKVAASSILTDCIEVECCRSGARKNERLSLTGARTHMAASVRIRRTAAAIDRRAAGNVVAAVP